MAIVLNGTTGITAPDIDVTAQTTGLDLSGSGVYLGGTGSANYLQDYETGTWTPGITTGSVASADRAHYIKIGGMVTVTARMNDFSDYTSADAVLITGLPFTVKASTNNPAPAGIAIRYYTSNGTQVVAFPTTEATTFSLLSVDIQSAANWVTVYHDDFSAVWDMQFSVTYFTDD